MNLKQKLENFTENYFNVDELVEICDEYILSFLNWYYRQPNKILRLPALDLIKLYRDYESNR